MDILKRLDEASNNIKLKSKKSTFYETDYDKVDKFINSIFPQLNGKFESLASEEIGNDVYKVYRLDGKISSYNQKSIEKGDTMHMVRTYLNDAVRQGIIPKGDYLVEYSW